jgi:hypothetical protein
MNLKEGVLYDAIHKTETFYDTELQAEVKLSMILEIRTIGKMYHDVIIHEKCGYDLRKNEFIYAEKWDFYEIRKGDPSKDEDSLLEIQRLAVELGNKDLFDRCNKDLQELGYGVS